MMMMKLVVALALKNPQPLMVMFLSASTPCDLWAGNDRRAAALYDRCQFNPPEGRTDENNKNLFGHLFFWR